MTWEQLGQKYLCDHGMIENEAKPILAYAKEHKLLESIWGRWSDSIDGYPVELQETFIANLRKIALEWTSVNWD